MSLIVRTWEHDRNAPTRGRDLGGLVSMTLSG
jgi:hypothetical protein